MQQLSLVDAPVRATEFVYYATDMCNIKIGRTCNPRRRGGELRVQMLLTIPGGDLDERRHHRMWRSCRIGSSEWFRPTDELMLWLSTRLLGNGPSREAAILGQMILGLKRRVAA